VFFVLVRILVILSFCNSFCSGIFQQQLLQFMKSRMVSKYGRSMTNTFTTYKVSLSRFITPSAPCHGTFSHIYSILQGVHADLMLCSIIFAYLFCSACSLSYVHDYSETITNHFDKQTWFILLFQDAKKGVLFIDFPPVLQLQLKRFEYDFMHDAMVKACISNMK
jgi:hypothetical protein